MKYYGSKRRLAEYILPIILKDRKNLDQYYVEPFCGGCNLIDKVDGKRMASDINRPLIALLKGIVNGWTPPGSVSKEEYYVYKALYKDGEMVDEPTMGWVGFCCSFCGRFMEGYAADFCDTDKKKRYQEDAKKNLAKQAPNLKGVEFYSGSYDELPSLAHHPGDGQ
jgi:DNA adenine methylase